MIISSELLRTKVLSYISWNLFKLNMLVNPHPYTNIWGFFSSNHLLIICTVHKELRAEMNDSASVSMGTSDVGGCGTVRLYTCLCVSLQLAYLNFVFMTWHAFRNHWQISSWWNRAGQRSLEAIECKYNKEELLLISALVSENGTRRQAWFLTAICWLAGIAKSVCIAKSGCHGKCKQWCIRTGIRKPSCW